MDETAAHLTDRVLPDPSVRQQVLAVPKRLRYFWNVMPSVGDHVAPVPGADGVSLRARSP